MACAGEGRLQASPSLLLLSRGLPGSRHIAASTWPSMVEGCRSAHEETLVRVQGFRPRTPLSFGVSIILKGLKHVRQAKQESPEMQSLPVEDQLYLSANQGREMGVFMSIC